MDNTHLYGFRPVQPRNGTQTPDTIPGHVATGYQAQDDTSTNNVDLRIGDPVQQLADGSFALANQGDLLYGVILAVGPYWDGTKMVPGDRIPGGNAWGTAWDRRPVLLVAPIESSLWEVDADSAGQPTTDAGWAALVGSNVDFAIPSDITDTGRPKADPFLDVSTVNTTATLPLRIVQVSDTVANKDLTGANVKLIVAANATQAPGAPATPVAGI